MGNKILVAYFSATNNTKIKSIDIANKVKGDLFEITPKQAYKTEDLDWTNNYSRSSIEIKDSKCRPEIKEFNKEINNYDTIYIGFPIWWGIVPNIIKTFLDGIDLNNKKIITFCTSGGSSLEPATMDLKNTYPNSNIESGTM